MKPSIQQIAKGKWPSILQALGVDKSFLVNRHGPCPVCQGKDRFRFDDKDGKGTFFCNQCGGGDGVKLLQLVNNWEFKEVAREVERIAGTARAAPIRNGPDPRAVRQEMARIWRETQPLASVEATERWWRGRLGQVWDTPDVRATRAMTCPGAGVFAGMVAKVRAADGKWINLHRTFLTDRGEKPDFPEHRRVMPLELPKGCAVRLAAPGVVLGIAEGIETAVAASIIHSVPVWAALNAVNLEGWRPPEGVEHVIVFGDNDASFAGQAAAYSLARNLRRLKIAADVLIPLAAGHDWNDVLLTERSAKQAA